MKDFEGKTITEYEEEKLTKRLILDIPKELHHEIKSQAAWRNITIRRYVLQALLWRMEHDKKFD